MTEPGGGEGPRTVQGWEQDNWEDLAGGLLGGIQDARCRGGGQWGTGCTGRRQADPRIRSDPSSWAFSL